MPVFTTEATRTIEAHATLDLGLGVLMRRAGEAVARLALACNPHTHIFWVACARKLDKFFLDFQPKIFIKLLLKWVCKTHVVNADT